MSPLGTISTETRQRLDEAGAALSMVWGGPQKQRYYTPSGEEVWAIPSIREWTRSDASGKVVATGTRDANLDRGWLLTPPAVLKFHCPGCDQWHDTEKQVEACRRAKARQVREWERKAQKMASSNGGGTEAEIKALGSRLDRLETLLERLLETKG